MENPCFKEINTVVTVKPHNARTKPVNLHQINFKHQILLDPNLAVNHHHERESRMTSLESPFASPN